MREPFILLVEDNPDDTLLIQWAYRQFGCSYELVVVTDGAAALELLLASEEGRARIPALVLLDLKLPRIEGAEVLRRLRGNERTRIVPIVVLTSSREERDLAECYTLGANSYIRKPVDFSEYRDTLTQVWRYWLDYNVTPDQVWG